MSGENGAGGDVGLVLGGGGARGAYTSGALSVLLPELKDQVRVIVGTSAGALIASYLVANWHRPAQEAIEDGLSFWRDLTFRDVCAPLMAVGGATRFMRYVGEFLPVRSMHGPSILHPEPLRQTLARIVDFDQLGENIREQRVALGVVAAPAYGNRSVVFHQGGIPRHREDPLRGIEYVATPALGPEHILASSAIPALFPAVRVTTPEPAAGWYYDGGSRLNTPIKPALWMGAKRVIVIALNSVAPSRTAAPAEQPDFYVGAAHLLHAALGDPLAQDIRTLANTNALIGAGLPATNGRSRDHRPATRRQQPGGLHGAGPARALHLHRARGPLGDRRDRPARLPQALQAPLEGRRARSVAAGKDPRRRRRRDARRALELPVLRRRIRRGTDPARPSRRAALDRRAPGGPLAARSATRLEPSPQRRRRRAQLPAPSASTCARSRRGARHGPKPAERRDGCLTEQAGVWGGSEQKRR